MMKDAAQRDVWELADGLTRCTVARIGGSPANAGRINGHSYPAGKSQAFL